MSTLAAKAVFSDLSTTERSRAVDEAALLPNSGIKGVAINSTSIDSVQPMHVIAWKSADKRIIYVDERLGTSSARECMSGTLDSLVAFDRGLVVALLIAHIIHVFSNRMRPHPHILTEDTQKHFGPDLRVVDVYVIKQIPVVLRVSPIVKQNAEVLLLLQSGGRSLLRSLPLELSNRRVVRRFTVTGTAFLLDGRKRDGEGRPEVLWNGVGTSL